MKLWSKVIKNGLAFIGAGFIMYTFIFGIFNPQSLMECEPITLFDVSKWLIALPCIIGLGGAFLTTEIWEGFKWQ